MSDVHELLRLASRSERCPRRICILEFVLDILHSDMGLTSLNVTIMASTLLALNGESTTSDRQRNLLVEWSGSDLCTIGVDDALLQKSGIDALKSSWLRLQQLQHEIENSEGRHHLKQVNEMMASAFQASISMPKERIALRNLIG